MNVQEIRKLTTEELVQKVAELKVEYAEAKFQVRIGQEADTAKLRIMRKTIARVMTELNKRGEESVEETVEKVKEEKVEKEEDK